MIITWMKICKRVRCRRECVEVTNCVTMSALGRKRRLIDNFKTSIFNLKSLLQIIDFE